MEDFLLNRRNLCKPLANRLEKEAASHPTFRRLINTSSGQANDRLTTEIQHSTTRNRGRNASDEALLDTITNSFFIMIGAAALIFRLDSGVKEELALIPVTQAHQQLSRECDDLKHQLELKRSPKSQAP